jgi:putative flippase GtrA
MSETDIELPPSLATHVIFLRYVLFAVVSSLTNLASQEMVIRLVPLAPLMVSVLTGTGIGFLAKYALEKRWIFLDSYDGHTDEIRKIFVYGVFGIATTFLFWGIELGAWRVWQTTGAKYAGAAIGLLLGNWLKYTLDRRYVFRRIAA